MQKGQIDNAVRRAFNIFDKWNDITGLVPKYGGYYYEFQGVIEDAVHCGIQGALEIEELLDSEKK